jgi:hypothetical protein
MRLYRTIPSGFERVLIFVHLQDVSERKTLPQILRETLLEVKIGTPLTIPVAFAQFLSFMGTNKLMNIVVVLFPANEPLSAQIMARRMCSQEPQAPTHRRLSWRNRSLPVGGREVGAWLNFLFPQNMYRYCKYCENEHVLAVYIVALCGTPATYFDCTIASISSSTCLHLVLHQGTHYSDARFCFTT